MWHGAQGRVGRGRGLKCFFCQGCGEPSIELPGQLSPNLLPFPAAAPPSFTTAVVRLAVESEGEYLGDLRWYNGCAGNSKQDLFRDEHPKCSNAFYTCPKIKPGMLRVALKARTHGPTLDSPHGIPAPGGSHAHLSRVRPRRWPKPLAGRLSRWSHARRIRQTPQ